MAGRNESEKPDLLTGVFSGLREKQAKKQAEKRKGSRRRLPRAGGAPTEGQLGFDGNVHSVLKPAGKDNGTSKPVQPGEQLLGNHRQSNGNPTEGQLDIDGGEFHEGSSPERGQKVFESIPGELQIQRFIALGFADYLHISDDEYRARFPEEFPKPPWYKGRFDYLVIVDPQIPLEVYARAAGLNIDRRFYFSEVTNLQYDYNGYQYKQPHDEWAEQRVPYAVWMQNGNRKHYRPLTKEHEKDAYGDGEVLGPLIEALAFLSQYPEMFDIKFNEYGLCAVGSRIGSSNWLLPCIDPFFHRRNPKYPVDLHAAHLDFKRGPIGDLAAITRGATIISKQSEEIPF